MRTRETNEMTCSLAAKARSRVAGSETAIERSCSVEIAAETGVVVVAAAAAFS